MGTPFIRLTYLLCLFCLIFTCLEACLCFSVRSHPPRLALVCFSPPPVLFSFCVIFSLPSAQLPELVTNVPAQRLVKHLYSTLGCVITFNPVPFLSWSASQRRMLFSAVFTDSVRRDMESNSCPTSLISSLRSLRQVEVLRRQEIVLTCPAFLQGGIC